MTATHEVIPLTQAEVAIVDPDDFEMLRHFKWTYGCGYAYRGVGGRANQHMVKMERMLLLPGPGECVDHINGDKLDNRRCNLRVCTQRDNSRNSAASANNRFGYKGVSIKTGDRRRKRIRARITVDGRERCLGLYLDPVDAALAYDLAALRHFGEFARTNFLCGPIK